MHRSKWHPSWWGRSLLSAPAQITDQHLCLSRIRLLSLTDKPRIGSGERFDAAAAGAIRSFLTFGRWVLGHGLQKVLGSLANIVGANGGRKDEEDAKAWSNAGNVIELAREIIESRFVL